jgi:membrane fusion protein, multidrug efflux system
MARLRLLQVVVALGLLTSACSESASVPVAAEPRNAGKAGKEVAAPGAAGGERAAAGAARASGRGGSGRGGAGAAGQRQAVEVIAVQRRDLSETLRVVGSLAPNETATIRPEMSGLVRSIHFEEGQPVKKGMLLLKIEDSELRAQLAQTQSRHELARLNLARSENLRQTQSTTQADVDRTRAEFTATQAELELLQVRLARTELRAPFDGVAEARTISPGDYVSPQSVITTINDLSRLKVEFQVPERYLSKIGRDTKFEVRGVGGQESVAGEVYFVNSIIDRNTRSSEVKGFITGSTSALRAGMFALIEIVLEVRRGALTVPEGSILVEQRGPQIITVGEHEGEKVANFVPVSLGLRSRGLVEVRALKGELTEKQLVIAAGVGSLALFPGARIEPRPLRSEFVVEN